MKVGVLIFDGVEELDFVGPWEVLSYVNKVLPESVQMYLVGVSSPVTAHNGMQVIPHLTPSDCPQLDVLVVPGGKGRLREMYSLDTLNFIRGQYDGGLRFLASVCTGAFMLAEAGLLDGKQATTHHSALGELAEYPNVTVTGDRLARTGNIVCAAGISSGIDLGLYLLAELFSSEIAARVAESMEWPGEGRFGARAERG